MAIIEKGQTRQQFLLTFFELPHRYEAKEVNGFILVRQWNGNTGEWNVAIYTQESWKNAQKWREQNLFAEKVG